MGGRVGERTNDLELLDDGPRPAVRDDDGQRIRVTGADVDEVNVDSIDRRDELREAIQFLLHLSPVVVRAPIANQRLKLRQLRTLRLIGDGFLVGPPRCSNAPPKITECGLGYFDGEGPDRTIFDRGA